MRSPKNLILDRAKVNGTPSFYMGRGILKEGGQKSVINHLRSLDREARGIKFIEKASTSGSKKIYAKVRAFNFLN